jgi:hypothetical protein
MIYELRLPASLQRAAKQPYDTDNHKALLYACERLVKTYGIICVATDISIYIDFWTGHLPTIVEMSSFLTFEVARLLAPFRIVFDVFEFEESWQGVHIRIGRLSKARYEMYLENHDLHKDPSLFGASFYLPYEKTPVFFREGISVP